MNPQIDAVLLAHAGRTVTLRFTWRVLGVVQRDWGDEWTRRFADALTLEKVDDLAEIVALLTNMTKDEVLDWSPPTAITVQALWDAYGILKLGRKPKPESEADAQNPPTARSILSKAFAFWPFAPASPGPISGSKPLMQPASR